MAYKTKKAVAVTQLPWSRKLYPQVEHLSFTDGYKFKKRTHICTRKFY